MNDFRCWVEIERATVSSNIRLMKSKLNSKCNILIVVKGDAYGHGIVESSKIAISEGASFLGIAYMEEARILRSAKITSPILLLTQPFRKEIPLLIKLDIIPTVYSYKFAQLLSKEAVGQRKIIKVHIKIDTGLNRLGLKYKIALREIRKIYSLPFLEIEGIYTHFASATNSDLSFAKTQLNIFLNISSSLKQEEISVKYLHTANSPALAWLPESHLNLVRLGMSVFGLQPSLTKKYPLPIRCGLSFKTRVLLVKELKKDEAVGYDNSWRATESTKLATIAIGYADGFRFGPKNFGYVLCGGEKCPIVGKVSMSLSVIKIKKSNNVKIGDEVVIIGRQGKEQITLEDIAKFTGSSNEEIITNISKSLPRIYL